MLYSGQLTTVLVFLPALVIQIHGYNLHGMFYTPVVVAVATIAPKVWRLLGPSFMQSELITNDESTSHTVPLLLPIPLAIGRAKVVNKTSPCSSILGHSLPVI